MVNGLVEGVAEYEFGEGEREMVNRVIEGGTCGELKERGGEIVYWFVENVSRKLEFGEVRREMVHRKREAFIQSEFGERRREVIHGLVKIV